MPVGNSSIKRAATAIANPDKKVVDSFVTDQQNKKLDDECKNCKVGKKAQCDAPKATKTHAVKEKAETKQAEPQSSSTPKSSRSNDVSNQSYGIGSALPVYLL